METWSVLCFNFILLFRISSRILTPATSTATPTVKGGAMTPILTVDAKVPEAAVPRDVDHKLEKIWADYESVEPYLVEDSSEDTVTDVRVEYGPVETPGKPLQVSYFESTGKHFEG